LISKVERVYTKAARQAKLQGTVVLYIEVDPTGQVLNPKVIRGLGLGLDEKAIEAVVQWKFRPGLEDGKPVTVTANVECNFRLEVEATVAATRPDKLPLPASEAPALQPYEFVGALELVTQSIVSIRLSDGRIIEAAINGDLDAAEIGSARRLGDIVRIQCKSIPQLYDEAEDRLIALALVRIQFVRAPTEAEL
jgi:TonB family protein